jgi:signal recognition particle subunit SRP54
MFASNGEKMTDFDVFHPDRMASRILGMGDMLTLIEQAEKAFDADSAAKAAAKLQGKGGEFTLDDFLEQMQAVRKMGSLSKIMGMIPGMAQFRDQLENFDEREIDRIQALILSMTPAERANPKIIDGSRRTRIARGAGRAVSDVNSLVDRFFEARKMMMSMAGGGGMPGMPGMPGMGGKRAKARQQAAPKRSKRGSGNPAKRAAQASAATVQSAEPAATGAAAFGLAGRGAKPDVSGKAAGRADAFELPKDLRDLL